MTNILQAGVGKEVTIKTSAELHLYANSATGLDTNDGLTALTAVASLEAVRALVPDLINHNTCVHLAGSFDITLVASFAGYTFAPRVGADVHFVIDGGSDTTTYADDGGSPWTADISSTTTLGTTGNGWVVDAYKGLWVEVLTGAAAGETRLIFRNTIDTITPAIAWSVDPGACTYRICRPATTLTSTNNNALAVSTSGPGQAWVQNFYCTASFYMLALDTTHMNYGGLVFNNPGAFYSIQTKRCGVVNCGAYYKNVADFSTVGDTSANNYKSTGIGLTKFFWMDFNFETCESLGLNALVGGGGETWVISCKQVTAGLGGSRLTNVKFVSCGDNLTSTLFDQYGDYAPIELSGAVGLTLEKSFFQIDDGVDISNCTSHGVQLRFSTLKISGITAGSSNTGAGVFADINSTLLLASGIVPTLTGTVGDTSVDGATEASAWADVAATPVSDVARFNFIGEE